MREKYDRVFQLITVILIFMWSAVALAKLFPWIIYIYFGLSTLSILALITNYIYNAFEGRVKKLGYTSTLIITATMIIFFTGLMFSTTTIQIYIQQTIPIEEVTSLQIEMIPHLMILAIMFTTLLASQIARNKYREKYYRKVGG